MKRLGVALLVLSVMVMAQAVGCLGGKATVPPKPEKLVILDLGWWAASTWERVAERFEEQYGIKVEIETVGWVEDAHTKVLSAYAAGIPAYDVIVIDEIYAPQYAAYGLAADLSELATQCDFSLEEHYVDLALNAGSYGGKLVAVNNFAMGIKQLFYNVEMLAEAGYDHPPSTWEELAEISTDLMEKGICKYGIAFPFVKAEGLICDWVTFHAAFGGQWRDEKGRWIFNDEHGVKALQFMLDAIYKYHITPPASLAMDDRAVLDPLLDGEAPFSYNWTLFWGTVTDPEVSKVANSVALAPAPGSRYGNISSMSVSGICGHGVFALSNNKYWAFKLLTFPSLEENVDIVEQAVESIGAPPGSSAAYKDAAFVETHPVLQAAQEQFGAAAIRPRISYYAEWSERMQAILTDALAKNRPAQEVLDEMISVSNQISAKHGDLRW